MQTWYGPIRGPGIYIGSVQSGGFALAQGPDSPKPPPRQVVVPAPKVREPEEEEARFHKLGLQEPDWESQIDPEVGQLSIRDKRTLLGDVRGSIHTTFGQTLIAGGVSLALVCGFLFTLTAAMWNPSYVLAVLLIPSLLYTRHKYRLWSRKRGYLVRLAETLGEEV